MPRADVVTMPSAPGGWWRGVAEWHALDDVTKTRAKVVLLVLATFIAFHYSLITLVQTLGLDTPLAYVGLVPLLAGVLAFVNRSPRAREPQVHDRQLDYILGTPMVVLAVAGSIVLPARIGAMYWVNRLDLVLLPLFVAGATMLLFGARICWRQRVALAYLLLAWPWLYTTILLGALGGFTSLTVQALQVALHVVHVASPGSGAANEGLFVVSYHGHVFPISVVTACSGVDGIVGFFLIGAAFTTLVDGSIPRKLLWLATGLVLLWLTNILRLLGIFWIGAVAGEHVALGLVHPVAGIVMFALGVGIMTVLLRPFGLHSALPRPAPIATERQKAPAPAVFLAAGIVLSAALVLSVVDSGLKVYDPVASAAGEPKLASYLADPAVPAGWSVSYQTEFESNKPLFGEDSRWFRYLYVPDPSAETSLHSTLPITADVIDASGLGGFNAYGVTACYSFHGYALRDVADVDLGDGIVGQALSYWGGTSHQDWTIVYWVWPVDTGTGTRYERVVLSLQNTSAGRISLTSWTPGVSPPPAGRDVSPVTRRLTVNRAFLLAFARQIVAGQSAEHDTGVYVDALLAPGTTGKWSAGTPLGRGRTRPSGDSSSGTTGSSGDSDAVSPPTIQSASPSYVAFWAAYFVHHPRTQGKTG